MILPHKGTKYIQVDVDGTELGRSLAVDLGVVSDSCQYFKALTKELGRETTKAGEDWAKTTGGLKKLPTGYENAPMDSSPGRIHPYHGIKKAFSSLEPSCILVIDGGECSSWSAELQEFARPSMVLFALGHLGFLGNGFGYAIGAELATPSKKIVLVQGDGSAGFHFAELDIYSRHGLNVLTIVVNNYMWAMSQHGQDLMWRDKNESRPVTTLSQQTAFEVGATGFGNIAKKVDKYNEIEAAVQTLCTE